MYQRIDYMLNSKISNQAVYQRMDILSRAMGTWREAEKKWLKAHSHSKAGHLDAIYPALLNKIAVEMTVGIKKINTAFRDLASDYAHYSINKKFMSQYKDRIEMIEVLQEDLNTYMSDLKKCMTTHLAAGSSGFPQLNPAYREGIRHGGDIVIELQASLEQTKLTMQQALTSRVNRARM
tara:strand:- start:32801 stop:33337 length:537 start_codon:yes stop_codon:yes gene_type:complete